MPQNTNLNVSPYFDDFDSAKNFNRVLFKPGTPVQARELTTLQSILQGQIEKFGKHIFKEGSMVIPGKFNYDPAYTFVKIESTFFGVPVESYYDKLIGLRIKGKNSGIKAKVLQVLPSTQSTTNNTTLYIKFESTSNDLLNQYFIDGENLVTLTDFTYGSTTVTSGSDFATCILSNATGTASSFTMNRGIFFARGAFVEVSNETLILDQYSNTPSYRVGFFVKEDVVTAVDDPSLYDNAAGFSNFTAPGADRLKVSLSLTKKGLTDFQDENFIELFRTDAGQEKLIVDRTVYNHIADEFARRTFDESGNYFVTKFDLEAKESLNDRFDYFGTYYGNQKTEEGNTPSKDLLNIRVGPGKAYVRGFEVQTSGHAYLDVKKPRTTQKIENSAVPFQAGNRLRVNNVLSAARINLAAATSDFLDLRSARLGSTKSSAAGNSIGRARIYDYKLQNAGYTGDTSVYELYLMDIQTDTQLVLNKAHTISVPAIVEGASSGAKGYIRSAVSNSTAVTLNQTQGKFIIDEAIIINGVQDGRVITSVTEFDLSDVKSVRSTAASRTFAADVVLETKKDFGGRSFSITNGGAVTSGTTGWVPDFKVGDVVSYKIAANNDITYNVVSAISTSGNTITLVAAPDTISGICHKALPSSTVTVSGLQILSSKIKNSTAGFLYAQMPNTNIESVDLTDSTLFLRKEDTSQSTDGNGQLTLPSLTGTDLVYAPFDEERYNVTYNDGSVQALTSDQVVIATGSKSVTISGLTASQSGNVVVQSTHQKSKVKSKQKSLTRNATTLITKSNRSYSGVSSSITDGLTPSEVFGLRVQDREISLGVPDVVRVTAVFESSGSGAPTVPTLTLASFNGPTGNNSDLVIGEVGVGKSSGASALILDRKSANKVEVIFTNGNKFQDTEEVTFSESGVTANLSSASSGDPNIRNNFILDSGQRAEFYDFGRLVRKANFPEPQGQLKVYFDHYVVNSEDSGDIVTASSYPQQYYDISPAFEDIRNVDTIDARPRVAPYSGSRSPFEFDARDFSAGGQSASVLVSDENITFDYNFYLGRIDRLYVNKDKTFTIKEGVPAENPVEPDPISESFELARIDYAPYVYNATKDVKLEFRANKRYTMKDIGKLETRISNVEEVTALSLLESKTDSLVIKDPATGLDRFKNGFVVDPFNSFEVADKTIDSLKYDIKDGKLVARKFHDSIDLLLGSESVVGTNGAADPTVDARFTDDLGSPNIRKTGDYVTLDYTEVVDREQPFATRVESVNPYAFRDWGGVMTLNPDSDIFVNRVFFTEDGGIGFSNDFISETEPVPQMREQNIAFTASRLKPNTNMLTYWSGIDMIENNVRTIPKLLEVTPVQGAFQIGETVRGLAVSTQNNSQSADIRFRVCQPNHKFGPFNNPIITYPSNPYTPSLGISSSYTETSTIINVDIDSLNQKSDGNYFGFVTTGMRLVGETSGAEADVTQIRLISDEYGALQGCYYIPEGTFQNGTNTASVTSIRPQDVITGQNFTSAGADHFSEGFEVTETTITRVEPAPPIIPPPVIIHHTEIIERTTERVIVQPARDHDDDPLAQSFFVEEDSGIFLTSVDFYFLTKSESLPVDVRIVSVENGYPTNKVLKNARVILNPDEVNISSDGTVATNFKFPNPVYLVQGEYSFVIGSADADYQAWICQIGEEDISTAASPELGKVIVSKQPTQGSLFKGQNGSTWTPSQLEDLKYKAYKAEFTTEVGTLRFYNPDLGTNASRNRLSSNPIETFSKRVTVGLNSSIVGGSGSVIHVGSQVKQNNTSSTGFVSNLLAHIGGGASGTSLIITNEGTGYEDGAAQAITFNAVTGNGSGATGIATVSGGVITSITVNNTGSGYRAGDTITGAIGARGLGKNLLVTVGLTTGVNAIELTNVSGTDFNTTDLIQVQDTNLGYGVTIPSIIPASVTTNSGKFDGKHFKVTHANHNLHSGQNRVAISGITGDAVPTTLTVGYAVSATSLISVGSSLGFNFFEGAQVTASNPGYAIIGEEVISYTAVGTNQLSGTISRGVDNTFTRTYAVGDPIQKYELSGVSLRKINTEHSLADVSNNITGKITLDDYHVRITGDNLFNRDKHGGGDAGRGSSNIQFESIEPTLNFSSPENTKVEANLRTCSGTSIGGNETSFIDKGYAPLSLTKETKYKSPRLVASLVNEANQNALKQLPGGKSLTMDVALSTSDKNVSPVVNVFNSSLNTKSSRVNKPVENYISDRRSNLLEDPHDQAYVTKLIKLENPATSLKVIFGANITGAGDVRVLYRLQKVDGGGETDKVFQLMPGFENLDSGGFLINGKNNNGKSDRKIPASLEGQFNDYTFTAENLPAYNGFQVKVVFSSSNQAQSPELLDFRAISLA